jgi:hypothetical protein
MPITRAYGQASQLGNTPSASNPVINGGMDVWQRGTSISLAASTLTANGYTADRWVTYTSANQATTVSRQTTSDTTNLPSIQYCLRYQRNSGQTGTAEMFFLSNLESSNSIPFAGKTVTYSFYARKGSNYSATNSILIARLYTGTGTDQNAIGAGFTGVASPIDQNATLTTTWQRFTYTATLATNITQIAVGWKFEPTGTASTNDYFEVTGVQIDVGSVALPFRRAQNTLAGELAACQRYYYRTTSNTTSSTDTLSSIGFAYSTTNATVQFQLPVTMRVKPTAVDYANIQTLTAAGGQSTISSLTLNNGNNQIIETISVSTGLTSGNVLTIRSNALGSGYVGFSAEL